MMPPPPSPRTQALYILCGLPFASKTALARGVERRFGSRRVSIDEINGERGLGLSGAALPAAEQSRTYAEAYSRAARLLQQGVPVLLDASSFTRSQRDEMRTTAAARGIPAYVLFVEVPVGVARERWLANRAQPVRNDVSDDEFALVVDQFEPPANDERVLRHDVSEPLAEWITRTFS